MAEEDLIFGKNRHFFGGIEPSNMKVFTAGLDAEAGKVRIVATLPDNTVINDQTLCIVAGAIIRRKTTGYPVDEFDGDLVANIKTSANMLDPNTNPTGTYYYAAFPYTTQGVYNRNPNTRAVVNEPEPMTTFTASSVYDGGTQTATVSINAVLPSGVAGAVIRKSTTGYPIDETDGDAFMTISASGTYTDASVEVGGTYYYAAFPFTSTGAYNRSETNRATVTVSRYEYLFGFDLDMSDQTASTRVTYPDDVDNAAYTPAKMNFSTGQFNYGSWNITPGTKFMPRPCMQNFDNTVAYYLDPDDNTKKADGTSSDVANTSFNGNAMMEWGKIYVHREVVDGVYKFRCSNVKMGDDWECYSNYDRNNNEIDHFYTPIYFGSLVSNKLRSLSGQSNMVSKSASDEITYAKANGNDWYTEVLADRLLIEDLLVMMAKSTDTQESYGYGVVSASAAISTGTMNTKGMFWGSSDKTSGVKVFGMENFWGNIRRRIAGWMYVNRAQKVKLTRGTHDGSTASDYNIDGTGYITVANSKFTGSSGGYISEMLVEDYGRLPKGLSGSSSTFEADIAYFNDSGTFYAYVGGNWGNGLVAGAFYVALANAASNTDTSIGAALSCKPLAA